ncbi:MAG: tetratricopeptide repeat protein [Cytophagales bacterium]|nr:MAG: tetratricopeptide repeat protein [Cytophagales bacterium]
MEVLAFVFIMFFVVGVALLMGWHKDLSYQDRKKYKIGIQTLEKHDYNKAFDYFDKAIQSNPKTSAILYAFRGRCHLHFKNYYHALSDCQKALQIDYNLKECYLDRGKAFFFLHQYEEALREFEKAVWYYHEKSPEAYRFKGLTHYELGNTREAENDFKQAIRLKDEEANYYLLQIKKRQDVF